MVCTLIEKDGKPNWCTTPGHGYHPGHLAQYAVDPGPKGQKFRDHWDRLHEQKPTLKRDMHQCRHLGQRLTWEEGKQHNEELIRLGVKQNTCGGKRHEYHCSVHKFTSMGKCMNCDDYAKRYEEIKTRHLIYHIYPVAGNGTWQWNVEQLCGRLKCFNGRKIIAIVTDPKKGRLPDPKPPNAPDTGRDIRGCDTAEAVKAEFLKRWGLGGLEFYEFENDPCLREVKTLIPMLEMLPQDDPHSVTFYAQAKGVTRRTGHIARRWTEALYEIYFDYFPYAMEQLMEFPVTGAFKKLGQGWSPDQSHSDWHYSGSWFWFRNTELFARNWRKIDQFWSGIEPYPSQHFRAKESGSLFLCDQVPHMNLYHSQYWRMIVFPGLANFRKNMERYRTDLWPK